MYFAIEGVIGAGKTSLARLLQPAFQAQLLLEVFEENPFLSDFYTTLRSICLSNPDIFLAKPLPPTTRACGPNNGRGTGLDR